MGVGTGVGGGVSPAGGGNQGAGAGLGVGVGVSGQEGQSNVPQFSAARIREFKEFVRDGRR